MLWTIKDSEQPSRDLTFVHLPCGTQVVFEKQGRDEEGHIKADEVLLLVEDAGNLHICPTFV